MAEKLKPCPFCGIIGSKIRKRASDGVWIIICFSCLASVKWFSDKDETIKAWNRRADNG